MKKRGTMSGRYEKIYPGVVNEVVCVKCLRENEILVDSNTRQHFVHTCICTNMTRFFVVNRRRSERLPADGFGTCWLGEDERGVTIKISDVSDHGLGMNFIGLRKEIEPKIIDNAMARVIYSKNGEIISSPQKIIFKNIHGMRVGAEFLPGEKTRPKDASPRSKNAGASPKAGEQITPPWECSARGYEGVEKVNGLMPGETASPNRGAPFSAEANRRKTPRLNVSFPGRISDYSGEMHDVSVRNFSQRGVCFMLLETDTNALDKKKPLILSFLRADKAISGKVRIVSFSENNKVHGRFQPYNNGRGK